MVEEEVVVVVVVVVFLRDDDDDDRLWLPLAEKKMVKRCLHAKMPFMVTSTCDWLWEWRLWYILLVAIALLQHT